MRSPSPTASPRAPADRGPRLRPLGVGIGLFLLVLFLVAGFKTWRDLAVVEAREADLESSIAAAEEDIAELEVRLERIAGDPAVLERLAREELAMTYPDEMVVLLPPEPAEAVPRRRVAPETTELNPSTSPGRPSPDPPTRPRSSPAVPPPPAHR